eukprot:scaffold4870_cov128-Skeletonema_marinoi.AAC.2
MRVYKIGCTKDDGVLPETIRDKENHPLKDGSRMREFTLSKEELWDGMKEELQEFLRGRNDDDKKNQKNKKAKLQKVTEREDAKRSRPGTAKSADTTKSGESGTSTSSKKKGKRRKRQQTELKEKIKEKKKELVELIEQLCKMKEDEAWDCPRVDATENRPQADEEAPQMTATAQTLSYVLNGKAGKFTKDLRVVTLGDLEEGLLHLDEDKQNSKAEATRKKTNLKPFNYGATSCWVPAGAAVIGKKDLTKLNQKAEIVKKLDSFFSSNQSAFSPQALRILTMFGLSNMGGSDEGMEMLIAGVLKALCHDIGFKVDSKKLGKVVPSRRTIARQEKNLMVDCLLHAVQEMTKDQIKYLFLIVDHGKRNGIEHFVKLVRWGGLDEKGNRVIKQLCLDMDMSGHTAKSAADAIKHSLKKLEKAGLNLDLVTAVDIFDDKTWAVGHDGSKHDFVTLLDEVHKRIAPHCTHGQGVENHVQAAGFVRKTNVGEERGSHRGTANSYISRRFNMISVLKLKAKKSTKEEKDRIQRVWGSTRITYFSDFVDKFARSVEEAAKNMDEVKRNELYAFIGSEQSRQSTKEKKELVNKVKTGVKKTRNVTKSEFVGGVEVTAEMDGGILFSILTVRAIDFLSALGARSRPRVNRSVC